MVHFTLTQCLYKGALYLTSVPVQWCTLPYLSACTRVHFTLPQCLYKGALYLTSVPVQGCTLPYLWTSFTSRGKVRNHAHTDNFTEHDMSFPLCPLCCLAFHCYFVGLKRSGTQCLDKLRAALLHTKSPALYASGMIIAILTRWQANEPIPHKITLPLLPSVFILFTQLSQVLLSVLFHSDFATKILYALPMSPIRASYPTSHSITLRQTKVHVIKFQPHVTSPQHPHPLPSLRVSTAANVSLF